MAARAEAVEPALAAIWAEVLGVEQVGPEDDFFELGGTSLLAMQIVARASDAFGVEVALDALFEAPTVAGLARQIDAADPPAGRRDGKRPRRSLFRRGPHRAGAPALSPLQASAWAIQRYNPDARPHVGEPFTLEGPLDVAALERALGELVARHEILRTAFPLVDFRPLPRVLAPAPVAIPVSTVAGGTRKRGEAELNALADAALAEPFDYETAPPLRTRLIRRGPTSHVLVLVTHEIVCDGWGFDALTRELSQLYDAFAAGRPAPSADHPLQYAEAVRAQQERRDGERGRAHWDRVLAELPLTLPLPYEAGGTPTGSGPQTRATARLPQRLLERLQALGREQAATSFMLHLAAFFVVLQRRTGEPRLRVTSPAANRNRIELEGVIGFFAQLLPLWVDAGDDPSFRTLLQRTRESTLQAFAYAEDLPENRGNAVLNGVRGLMGCGAVFRLWDATLERRPQFADVRSQPLHDAGEGGHLGFIVTERPGQETVADLSSSSRGFDRVAIEGMLADYVSVLERAVEDPDRRLSELIGTAASGRSAGARGAGEAEQRCLPELVAAQVARDPDAVAVRGAGGEQLTYGELDTRARSLAALLRARGAGRGTHVGLAIGPSAELVVALLAALQAGATCVPAEAFALVPEVDVLLTHGQGSPQGAPRAATVVDLSKDEDGADATDAGEDEPADAGPAPEDAALVIATAGVTGPPRAVTLSHRTLVHAALRRQHACRLTAQDRCLHVPGPGAQAWALAPWAVLASGARLLVAGHVPDASGPGTAAWLEAQDATVAALPPALASSCLSSGGLERSALRTLLVHGFGALRLPEGPRRGRPLIVREYAVAEAGGLVLGAPVGGPVSAGDPLAGEPPAASGIELAVLDPHGNPLPAEGVGELHLGGPGVAGGEAGLVPTGDRARRRADGVIEVFGRIADEVRFRGFRLNPVLHDLEGALASHPGVAAAAATWDAASETLVACLVPRRAQPPEPRELDRWLQQHMRDWVLPRRYVAVDAVPRRADGSPDRAALGAGAAPGRVLGDDPARSAPRSRTEKQLAAIFKKVLDRREVGVHESFFALGGALIDGVEAIERARAAGLSLTPPDLMLRPTIAELAEMADERA
jgi:non-ribosomal peptide synthetase component F/acyl carrier protein